MVGERGTMDKWTKLLIRYATGAGANWQGHREANDRQARRSIHPYSPPQYASLEGSHVEILRMEITS